MICVKLNTDYIQIQLECLHDLVIKVQVSSKTTLFGHRMK